MNKNRKKIQEMVVVASLGAIVAVLQYISMFIKFGPFNITLALTPIVVGAILYGPKAGGILGFIMGLVVLLTNSADFFVFSPFWTIVTCLLKSTAAGVMAGYINKWIKKRTLSIVVSSVVTPLINTGIFIIMCLIVFLPLLRTWAGDSNVLGFLFITLIGLQAIIEFVINAVLSPVVVQLVNIVKTKK